MAVSRITPKAVANPFQTWNSAIVVHFLFNQHQFHNTFFWMIGIIMRNVRYRFFFIKENFAHKISMIEWRDGSWTYLSGQLISRICLCKKNEY